MARPPKPWWNEDRGEYNVNIRGERHRLGPDKDEAERKFHELMAKPPEEPVKSESVAAVMDLFLTDAKEDCAEETYKWYRKHCQSFLDYLKGKGQKSILVSDLRLISSNPSWPRRKRGLRAQRTGRAVRCTYVQLGYPNGAY